LRQPFSPIPCGKYYFSNELPKVIQRHHRPKPGHEKGFQNWINQRWQRKDELIEQILAKESWPLKMES
jgi:hypothetical protein